MGLTIVIGGSSSGKSEYAEELLASGAAKKKYYIATMIASDSDAKRRVARHRKLREGKNFITIEQPRDIGRAAEKIDKPDSAALLECMSNLAANEMFAGDDIRDCKDATDPGESPSDKLPQAIMSGIERLLGSLKDLIIVTNNVFEDGVQYDNYTMKYLDALSTVNALLADKADRVVEVVAGIPIVLKEQK